MKPVHLASNRPPRRFYRGGAQLGALRGEPVGAEYEPEDWVASTTTVRGEERLGLTALPDGTLLRDAVAGHPAAWLGAAHAERWGADTRLLVKLLDAGQRLPVHAHPHDEFASAHLGAAHGKAEAWYILRGGVVHLGLREDVTHERIAALVTSQDVEGLLGLLHRIDVAPGDVVWVPPGELHAIGAGVLLLELQQPEDLSILLEWRDFAIDGAAQGHLGLGFELALAAVNLRARSREELGGLVRRSPEAGSVLPADAEAYFRLERLPVHRRATIGRGFAVILVRSGEVAVAGERFGSGSTVLVPDAAGALVAEGSGELLIARPPSPDARNGV
ncbi:class I mannose-6-phosphate isomerase [Microbacterium sp. XT11]|uniref:class I mannose-6-phosphate isomerase n=1 Tax=Microbacterium sp. XT11 TaxID=367477 RepID=UPI000835C660|nr:carbohydrate kinase [Microbacterium sp. XT11]